MSRNEFGPGRFNAEERAAAMHSATVAVTDRAPAPESSAPSTAHPSPDALLAFVRHVRDALTYQQSAEAQAAGCRNALAVLDSARTTRPT